MDTKKISILIVGEAHLNDERQNTIESMPRSRLRVLHSEDPISPNARGVAIVLNKELTETENVKAIEIKLSILGVYAPVNPIENTRFYIRKPDVMAGDMNIMEDPIDRFPARNDYGPAVNSLDEMRSSLHLIDGWQDCYPTTLKYTWQHTATGTQSHLDRIYVKNSINEYCYEWAIEKSGVPTDHDMVSVRFSTATAPNVGHGRWVMPLHIVKDRRALQKNIEKYATDEHRTPSMNPQTMWEKFSKDLHTLA
ncbi:hypothetical protein ARMGADRAFT_1045735 [Armillaria gallica]|uniref:Endonuclease/exonuclease/phosphatase domain-containing protein n=1 Tax=Armillaria gallica TaxID=47427 RepID=A0A2H3DTX8_ARMGA|nr:hypothetical protein ARMGADRAFT_1045735 [Armillaria gallica]